MCAWTFKQVTFTSACESELLMGVSDGSFMGGVGIQEIFD